VPRSEGDTGKSGWKAWDPGGNLSSKNDDEVRIVIYVHINMVMNGEDVLVLN
jgi:hypothetical protein